MVGWRGAPTHCICCFRFSATFSAPGTFRMVLRAADILGLEVEVEVEVELVVASAKVTVEPMDELRVERIAESLDLVRSAPALVLFIG